MKLNSIHIYHFIASKYHSMVEDAQAILPLLYNRALWYIAGTAITLLDWYVLAWLMSEDLADTSMNLMAGFFNWGLLWAFCELPFNWRLSICFKDTLLCAVMIWGAQEQAGFDSLKSTPGSQEHFLSNERLTFKRRGKIKVTINNLIPLHYASLASFNNGCITQAIP